MRRLIALLPVGLFLVLAGYFAWSLRPGHDPHELPSAMIDREAPPFDLAALSGDSRLTRDGLKGQPIVINFFASWCVPCRQEHPILMRLARQGYIQLYGIAYKDKPEDSLRLLSQLGDPYRGIGADRDGRTGLDFGVYGVPETYVIDASGHIRKRFVGPLTEAAVEKELLPLLRRLSGS
jgi:cytochrome c biogenesis protein CcmG/thiol:disulfide interchange protein DsbE